MNLYSYNTTKPGADADHLLEDGQNFQQIFLTHIY